jgi:hypothetical protein
MNRFAEGAQKNYIIIMNANTTTTKKTLSVGGWSNFFFCQLSYF